jgi:hypothetical protein
MATTSIRSIVWSLFACAVLLLGCGPDLTSIAPTGKTPISELTAEPQPIVVEKPVQKPVQKPVNRRDLLQKIYTSQIGVREATGKNDGPEVEMYLRATNLGKGNPWCAAYVRWCLDSAGVESRVTAWSPTAFNRRNPVYVDRQWIREGRHGDVFTLYYPKLERIGHTGFVDKIYNDGTMMQAVEGNTDGKSRDGDGVYLTFRPVKTIHNISSWIYD